MKHSKVLSGTQEKSAFKLIKKWYLLPTNTENRINLIANPLKERAKLIMLKMMMKSQSLQLKMTCKNLKKTSPVILNQGDHH